MTTAMKLKDVPWGKAMTKRDSILKNRDMCCNEHWGTCVSFNSGFLGVYAQQRDWPVFPAPLVKEIVFTPLYILASFVKDQVSIGAWIYLWAFYFVPLIYISVFVPVPYCLDDCGFVVEPEVRQVDSSSSLFSRLLWLFEVLCTSIQIVKLFVLALWKIPLVAW